MDDYQCEYVQNGIRCCAHAVWLAWIGRGVVRRLRLCEEHVKESIGYQAKQATESDTK